MLSNLLKQAMGCLNCQGNGLSNFHCSCGFLRLPKQNIVESIGFGIAEAMGCQNSIAINITKAIDCQNCQGKGLSKLLDQWVIKFP